MKPNNLFFLGNMHLYFFLPVLYVVSKIAILSGLIFFAEAELNTINRKHILFYMQTLKL